MNCDLCKSRDLNEVFVLRKNKFAKYCDSRMNKASRVCWDCARMLFRKKLYNFGHNWRMVFIDCSVIMEKHKHKYMVIHA